MPSAGTQRKERVKSLNISRIFIERPVASSVLFVSILFFGWLGFRTLPVNDLPNVDFPPLM